MHYYSFYFEAVTKMILGELDLTDTSLETGLVRAFERLELWGKVLRFILFPFHMAAPWKSLI